MPVAPHDTDETPARSRPRRRVLASLAIGLFALLFASACTPQEMREWWDWQGIDHSEVDDEEAQWFADQATAYWEAFFVAQYLESLDLAKFDHVLNDDQLYRLRWCESGDNYGAIGYRGLYRGAYQFSITTWDSVARQHYPNYQGIDPAAARPEVQDAMTRALWSMQGRSPWPHCGLRV